MKRLVSLEATKVKKILPKQLYERVSSILDLTSPSDYQYDSWHSCDEDENAVWSREQVGSPTVRNVSSSATKGNHNTEGEKIHSKRGPVSPSTGLYMNPPSTSFKGEITNAKTSRTPQFKFMHYSHDKAAWWQRDTEEHDISLLPLEQRAKKITTMIIADFVEWQKHFLGYEKPILPDTVLAELFDVDFDKPVAHALKNYPREIPYVTPMVARECALPDKEYCAGLRSEIMKDVEKEKQKPYTVAFGKTLPSKPRLRVQPPNNNIQERWLEASKMTKDLMSMEAVFKNIITLRSTIKFCQWLLEHPEIPPAQYLTKCGLIKQPTHSKICKHIPSAKSEIEKLEQPSFTNQSDEVLLARSLMEATLSKTAT